MDKDTGRFGEPSSSGTAATPPADDFFSLAPSLSLPKGGGAVRGIGEKFAANPVTGTGSTSIPIAISAGRGGFGPDLSLGYDSGAGNGPFGLGWALSVPSITRRTDRGLPRYLETDAEPDVFVLAGTEDLVPAGEPVPVTVHGGRYLVRRYRPRVESAFTLIERWIEEGQPANVYWRTISSANVTSWFGRDPMARITDPADQRRIFQWLLSETHDDRGDVVTYSYQAEDARGVDTGSLPERGRPVGSHTANRYLKTIRYGNLVPYLPTLDAAGTSWPTPDTLAGQEWMFSVVLDYGDHRAADPVPAPDQPWLPRRDPFSTQRPRFEVRTHRLCRRILMFHHFPDQTDVGAGCLVRSTDFQYRQPGNLDDPSEPGYTVLAGATNRGYRRTGLGSGNYDSRQFPPVTFTYSRPVIDATVRFLDPDELPNAPAGLEGSGYRWLDLDGEGLAGILSEQSGAWYYTPNEGDGTFGRLTAVAGRPSLAALNTGRQQLIDLTGSGAVDLVDLGGSVSGFHARDPDGGWDRFEPFRSRPNVDWADPDTHLVDLTGDGRVDLITTHPDLISWYEGLGAAGFAPSRRSLAEPGSGPQLVLAERGRSVFLADMSGDGMADLVQIAANDVRYWPNLGYGQFGAERTLANGPRLAGPAAFDPRRVRLADVDGSGPVDLIYLGADGAQLYLNRSGNSLSDPVRLDLPAATENLDAVQVVDLFGTGTACLVWNSGLPADVRRPVRYVDLLSGGPDGTGKPHLLTGVDNNLGHTVTVQYTPSTRFSLRDKRAGRPWLGRLPFPVHCVSRITNRDRWRGTAFSSTFSYHHGCFDGVEREFRGFGRVDRVDVEDYGTFAAANVASPFITADQRLYQPPVKTISWFHPGAVVDLNRVHAGYTAEYFRAAAAGFAERDPGLPELPAGLTTAEWREAQRACAGLPLRQEVYELDVAELAADPPRHTPVRLFSVATTGYRVDLVQPRDRRPHAVFLVVETESISYQHDLPLTGTVQPDPRISHSLTLRRDDHGRPVQVVTVGYPRRGAGSPSGLPAAAPRPDLVAAIQAELHLSYAETRFTADVVLSAVAPAGHAAIRHHRARLPWESRSYELTGITVPAAGYFTPADLRRYALCADAGYPPVAPPGGQIQPVTHLDYHRRPAVPGAHARLLARNRVRYFRDDDTVAEPSTPLPFGTHGPRGLTYESYRLALTDGLLTAVFSISDPLTGLTDDRLQHSLNNTGPAVRDLLDDPAASGYITGSSLDPALAGQYWTRTGVAGFGPGAAAGFYQPERYTDPFGSVTTVGYDRRRLFVQRSADPMGNIVRIERFDHRVLAPAVVVDTNGNRGAVMHDILGQVTAAATQGKFRAGRWDADHLDGLDPDPAPDLVAAFCAGPGQDDTRARAWLGSATGRFIYDLGEGRDAVGAVVWGVRMPSACSINRERHSGQLGPGEISPIQVSMECSDGSGAALLTKTQAEPDPVTGLDRWIVSGLTVVNNKGTPVKRYEPSFSARFGTETPVATGVCSVVSYDAAGRTVRVDHPDGTVSRSEFSPWVSVAHDRNDTVRSSSWYLQRGSPDPAQPLPAAATPEQRAAWLAAHHDGTPTLTVLDALGRPALGIAHNRSPDQAGSWGDRYQLTHTALDARGAPIWIRDARGNLVEQFIVPAKAPADPGDDIPAGGCAGYSLTGAALFQRGMDDGDHWSLPDATGAPMVSWSVNDRTTDSGAVVTEQRLTMAQYDPMHRPWRTWLRINAGSAALVEVVDHLDTSGLSSAALAAAQELNLVGQAIRHADSGGLSTVLRIGLGAAVSERTWTCIADVSAPLVDWNVTDRTALLAVDDTGAVETYRELTMSDALDRPVTTFSWHRDNPATPGISDRVAIRSTGYDSSGQLTTQDLLVQARKTSILNGFGFTPHPDPGKTMTVVTGITRNARGQRLTISHGNGTVTESSYDPLTFRLSRLITRRPVTGAAADIVQDLRYTYDAIGNITRIADAAQDRIFFANRVVDPSSDYTYDALYQLTQATGRENAAVAPPSHPEASWPVGPFPSSGMTRSYFERFDYDDVGNLRRLTHVAPGGSWTRNLDPVEDGNRLARSWYGTADWDSTAPARRVTHRHDRRGNIGNAAGTAPTADLRWNWRDSIRAVDLQGGGDAFYAYRADGIRVAKRLVQAGAEVQERLYLDGFERFRRWVGGVLREEVESLHVTDQRDRVLLVDDVLIAPAGALGVAGQPRTLPRYQYGNHLGSVAVELDDGGLLISREEFHPYGSTAFRLLASGREVPAKRYRFTGMERDEESGLSCHGARFYVSWLGRWTSVDPAGLAAGINQYAYCAGSPVMAADPSGLAGFMDPERLAADYAGTLLADQPTPEPDWLDKAAGLIDSAGTAIGEALDPELNLPSGYQFPLPFGYYDTYIDRQVARNDAAVHWYADIIQSGSVTVDWTDRVAAVPNLVLHEAGYLSAGVFYLAEHLAGGLLGLVGAGVEGIEGVAPGFKSALESLQGVPIAGPEFGLLARGSLLQIRYSLPLLNDARMAAAIAKSNVALTVFDDAYLLANPKAAVLKANQIKGVLKEAVGRDIEGLSTSITSEGQFLKMRSTTSAGRRADAPLFTGLTVTGESKPIILQVKDVRRLSERDLQQLVTSARSAAARNAVVHLHINPTTVLSWQARSTSVIRNLRLLDNAINSGRVVVFRYW